MTTKTNARAKSIKGVKLWVDAEDLRAARLERKVELHRDVVAGTDPDRHVTDVRTAIGAEVQPRPRRFLESRVQQVLHLLERVVLHLKRATPDDQLSHAAEPNDSQLRKERK